MEILEFLLIATVLNIAFHVGWYEVYRGRILTLGEGICLGLALGVVTVWVARNFVILC